MLRLAKIFLVFLAVSTAHGAQSLPNFVFILLDDYGRADTSCYGNTNHATPNIDRLAREGMRFTQAYATGPVCSPTRASIMTGKYPARVRITNFLPGTKVAPSQKLLSPAIRQQLPLEEITIAEALKQAGYATAHIGKWHLGGPGFGPEQQGFDINIAGVPPPYFAPFQRGERPLPGLAQSEPGEYITDRLTREAEIFIEKSQHRPFFLYLPHIAVHIPLAAKTELIAKYPKHPNPIYAAMIESVDDGIGRILQKLDRLNLAERTVVIFTSDNGGLSVREGPNTPATSNAPLRAGKGYLYEGGIRVPLIVRWPGKIKPQSTCDMPVASIDFFPTLAALAGVKPPRNIDGVSLLPLLLGKGRFPDRDLFWHYPHYSNQGGKPSAAIRSGDFKLIEFFEDGRLERYNLRTDPYETVPALLKTKMPEHKKLTRWLRRVEAQQMSPNPNYIPSESSR